jgi:hypothetical protein
MSRLSFHIFTDVGVKDCDDELCLKFVASVLTSYTKEILVVFTGSEGISAGDALAHWIRTFEANVLKNAVNAIFSYTTLADYKTTVRECDYLLQISPLDGYDGSNLVVRKKYVFAGDFVTHDDTRDSAHPAGVAGKSRPSFNRMGSDAILKKFDSEEKLVSIPSAHMVKMRFTPELLAKFPDKEFMDDIVFTAFLLIFARMSPTHGANKFAEGLINPDVGRGANYTSVMKTGSKLLGLDCFITPLDLARGWGPLRCINVKSCEHAAVNYCDALVMNGVTLKDRNGTIKYLTDINIFLQFISEPECESFEPCNIFQNDAGDYEVFVSDFDVDSIPEKLILAWNKFKSNSSGLTDCFNPVYDLFASYVLFGLVNGINRVDDTPEMFSVLICQEF